MKSSKTIPQNFPRYRLSKLFFYALALLLPIGTGKVFFTETSFFQGKELFYNSFWLYLTDLIIYGLIVTWILENLSKLREIHSLFTTISQDWVYRLLSIFWLILAISVLVSRETLLGIYGLVKFSETFLVLAYIRENIKLFHVKSPNLSQSSDGDNKVVSRETMILLGIFIFTLSIQALIGIIQYFSQKSLGLGLLGESYLAPFWKGIAVFISTGLVNPFLTIFFPYLSPISDITYNIRAYGTLPHANIFGGLMFFGLLILLFLIYNVSVKHWKIPRWCLAMFLLVTGLVVSFSRTIWLAATLGVVMWYVLIYLRIRRLQLLRMRVGQYNNQSMPYHPARLALITLMLIFSVGVNLFVFGPQIRDRIIEKNAGTFSAQESYQQRKLFNSVAFSMIKAKPLYGVGPRNFVASMQDYSPETLTPAMLQPVHNVYLLIAAESGLFALAVFIIFLVYIVQRLWLRVVPNPVLKYSLLIALFGFLFVGFFDHYIWTIQQGSLAFWILLGLVSTKE